MEKATKLKLVGGILLLLSLLLSTGASARTDTDGDEISDFNETNLYHTNPNLPDSDHDGYSDRMEIFGVGQEGEQMPSYIQFPGTHPLVSAHPEIEVEVGDSFTIFTNKKISFENRTVETFEHTYGTINTKTFSTSVGEGGSHTTSRSQDLINREKDINFESSHSNTLTSDTSYYSQQDTFGKERVTVKEVGGSVTAGARLVGPVPTAGVKGEAHASYTDRTTVEEGSVSFSSQGHSVLVDEGETKTRKQVYEEVTKSGFGEQETVSSSITTSVKTSVSKVDLYTIGSAKEWAKITTQDTSEWGACRINLTLRNTGTGPATNLDNLRLKVKIGSYVKTYPPLDMSGINPNNLPPGTSVRYPGALEIPLRLEEIKELDSGTPIEVSIIDFDYDEELTTVGAYSQGTLVQIDDGVSDGDEQIEPYLVPVVSGETYLDILKKLNHEVRVQDSSRNVIDVSFKEDSLRAIKGKEITNWSWWTAKTERISNKTFLDKGAEKGSKIMLTYHQDSDHDYYTDREELHRGHIPTDEEDHPSPEVIAGLHSKLYRNGTGFLKNSTLKFSNIGDYSAYGLEVRMYSPDNSTRILDEFSGGGVRIEPGESLNLSDGLSWSFSGATIESEKNFALASNGAEVSEGWEEVIDGNISQIISGSYGDNIIYLELPEVYLLNRTRILMHTGQCSSAGCGAYYVSYKLYTSMNGEDWELVSGGEDACSPTVDTTFDPTPAKYVKLVGRRWQVGGWNGYTYGANFKIKELELYGSEYEYKEPIVQVLYNDPQGPHRFLTNVSLESRAESLIPYKDRMQPYFGLSVSSDELVKIGSELQPVFSYLNPYDRTVNGFLHIAYHLKNGTLLDSKKMEMAYSPGLFSLEKTFSPSNYDPGLGDKEIILTAVSTDSQGVMFSEDLQLIKVEPSLKIINSTSQGQKEISENNSIQFFIEAESEAGSVNYQWFLDGAEITEEISPTYVYEPGFNDSGSHSVLVNISDGRSSKKREWSISVLNLNRPPKIEGLKDISVNETENISLEPVILDPDGDNFTVNVSEPLGDDWFWQTTLNDSGSYVVNVTATDGEDSFLDSFTLTVLDFQNNSSEGEDSSEDESSTPENDDSNGNFGGSGGGGAGSYAPEEEEETYNPIPMTDNSEKEEGSISRNELEQDKNKEASFTVENRTAPTGLLTGLNKKLSGIAVVIVLLVAAFLYTVLSEKFGSSEGPLKPLS